MRRIWIIGFLILSNCYAGLCQVEAQRKNSILFTGIIRDASSLSPLPNSQIIINGSFTSISDQDGTFAIKVNRRDTVIFSLLGYKSAYFYVSDTLANDEFIAGVYLKTDTLSIGEVIIMPRLPNLRSDIFKAPEMRNPEMENAKYNMAVSAYQGRIALSKLDDPASNYYVLKERQRINAIDKGGIPSSQMVSFSPLLLIPAAYLLLNGFPVPPPPMKSDATKQELDQIHKKYLESLKIKK
jgi:hypothetical protein